MVKNENIKLEKNQQAKALLDLKEKSLRSIRIKRKFQKLKTFNLPQEEKKLLESSDSDLKKQIIESIEQKIEEILEKLNNLNKQKESATSEEDKSRIKKAKKLILVKLAKNRKALTDEKEIKYRLSLLKQKKRKLKKVDSSVKENLEKLKKMNTRCFKCRRKGHTVAECKYEDVELNEENQENSSNNKNKDKENFKDNKKNICYNCGSTEHNVHGCNKPVDYKNLPFSQCFVCKEMGHLSSKCPKSDKGIYIKGGACYNCGEKDHLAKNCPTKQIELIENNREDDAKKIKKETFNKTSKNIKKDEISKHRNKVKKEDETNKIKKPEKKITNKKENTKTENDGANKKDFLQKKMKRPKQEE